MPRCKHCKEKFVAKFFNQKFCIDKYECIKAFVEETKRQKEVKEKKDWAKEKKERKEAIMTRKDWLDIAQKVVNTFIRERDKGKPCYMCQKPINGVVHACHYMSSGNHSFLRFHEDNIWHGCYSCNVMLSGNLIEFRKVLLKTIGKERLNWLEENGRQEKKWEIEDIKEIIKVYKEKTKQLIKSRI